MDFISLVLRRKAFFWFLMAVVAIGGLLSYQSVGKLESPTFKIKTATITAVYSGASASEVEREVASKLEEELQKLPQIENITSVSRSGFCIVSVEIRPEFTSDVIEQVWDEMRRRVNDIRPSLPSGVSNIVVTDDYGDVYGIFLALTGDGYGIDDLKDQADMLKKELLRVPQVAKITFWGTQTKAFHLDFDMAELSRLGMTRQKMLQALNDGLAVADAGAVHIGDEYSQVRISGAVDGEQAIRDVVFTDSSGALHRIGDLATVRRGHVEPATQIMRRNGKPAIGIGISAVDGANVVTLGRSIRARLEQLKGVLPAGMELSAVNFQADDVEKSIEDFMINLAESLAIVIGVLLITMGMRSGIIIGATLLLIILGTFICMDVAGIDMQIVSLGALIIALGMLVDNAIVVVDGCLVNTKRGMSCEDALRRITKETVWPLLGATAVAILAFGAVGLNKGNVGEFCRSLFSVIAISLTLSWIMAITFTPMLCLVLMPSGKKAGDSDAIALPEAPGGSPSGNTPAARGDGMDAQDGKAGEKKEDVFGSPVYGMYRSILGACLRHRIPTILLLFAFLGAAGAAFPHIPQSFFPDSSKTKFYIDYWRNTASHINDTAADADKVAAWVSKLPGIRNVTTFTGSGALRFILAYDYNTPSPDYAQIVMEADSTDVIRRLTPQIREHLRQEFPSADAMVLRFSDAMPLPLPVAVRFMGPDPDVLRSLAEQARTVFRESGNAGHLRDDWRPPVKNVRIEYSEEGGRRAGITRGDVAQSLLWNSTGVTGAVFRENDTLIPVIVSRRGGQSGGNPEDLASTRVWSGTTGASTSIGSIAEGIGTGWESPQIRHRDRMPAITVQCTPLRGTAEQMRMDVRKKIEAIPLPPLYAREWAGEYEESQKAQSGLKKMFPVFMLLMFMVVLMLFRTFREPVIAFATIPFALIGVVLGLVLTGQSFGFLSILGFLGLTGMLLKNAIVLLDQIGLERSSGVPAHEAVMHASVSRLRPVTMAAATTVLGMAPLITDAFFGSMAATIMFGLMVATVLILIVVPVAYELFFRIPPRG